jgi:hypothetical protein
MIPIPTPEGLELPDGPSEVTATVEMIDGQLVLIALNGVAFGDDEMEEPEMEDEGGDFLASVERNLAQ